MPMQASISKITRPRTQKVLPRTRLFRRLDQGRAAPVTWISGPAGSGKTTLVASYVDAKKLPCLWYSLDDGDGDLATFFYYMGLAAKKAAPRYKRALPLLTPEYGFGIPTFTRRFFENLYGRLRPPYVLVFDNYQDVPETSPFHEMIRHGLSIVPAGIKVITISRSAPPVHLSDLRAKNSMELVEWEELRFTVEESCGLLQRYDKRIEKNTLEAIYERTQGWAAGLVLMTGVFKSVPDIKQPLANFLPETIFDYFAGEILNRLDNDTRDFLLKSCFLTDMTVNAAEKLTNNVRAGQILSRLNRNNFFTERYASTDVVYSYHPLFREYLLNRLTELHSREDKVLLQKRAAQFLEEAGRPEDAAPLFIQAEDWQSLTALILRQAPQLSAQGRTAQIDAWLSLMPRQIVEDVPWLIFWKGMCRVAVNPSESLSYLEKAYQQFMSRKEATGAYLAWSWNVIAVWNCYDDMTLLDRWIDAYPSMDQDVNASVPAEIGSLAAGCMFTALVVRRPWQADLDQWLNKALAHPDANGRVQTLFYQMYRVMAVGGVAKAWQTIETLHQLAGSREATPLHRLNIYLFDIVFYNIIGQYPLCRAAVTQGLKLADESGVRLLDFMFLGHGIMAAYNYEDLATAEEYLIKLPSAASLRPLDRSLYYYLQALRSLHQKDLRQAFLFSEQALHLALKVNDLISPFLCKILHAYILHERGENEQAKEFLDRMVEPWRKTGRSHDIFSYHLAKAYLFLDDDDQTTASDSLRQALFIGREEGCVATYSVWQPAALCRLYSAALERGIEVEYARNVIRQRDLVPEEPPLHIENWPWPVKIFTLGEFRLLLDDKPVLFTGKVQKKPLEMLKALIAFGGEGVREELVIDALWPDADGDIAHSSFKTTLHRLRQLLGKYEMIMLQDGRISLDRRYCWTDVRAFERMLEESTRPPVTPSSGQVPFEKAVNMYGGHFLVTDADKPWAVSLRENLKAMFVRAISSLGKCSENRKDWDKAVAAYLRGLEVDDLVEEFYQRLMRCYLKLGRNAEAARTYERCEKVLRASLGVGPSKETESIYQTLIGKR